jgi:hypothetical protein
MHQNRPEHLCARSTQESPRMRSRQGSRLAYRPDPSFYLSQTFGSYRCPDERRGPPFCDIVAAPSRKRDGLIRAPFREKCCALYEQACYLGADRRGNSLNRQAVDYESLVKIRRRFTARATPRAAFDLQPTCLTAESSIRSSSNGAASLRPVLCNGAPPPLNHFPTAGAHSKNSMRLDLCKLRPGDVIFSREPARPNCPKKESTFVRLRPDGSS